VKVFDATDGTGFGKVTNLDTFADATIVRRGDRWFMYAAGSTPETGRISLWSASLPKGAPLSATGWQIETVPGDPTRAMLLAPDAADAEWDGLGGRHCPSYVKGWDPAKNGGRGGWEERIYYAGSTPSPGGPYSIGYIAFDGQKWVVPPAGQPVFQASAPWESNSGRYAGVYEPNLVYQGGKWRMWYVAGPPNANGQMPHGYAESVDGRTNWQRRKIYWPPEMDVFDNAVIEARDQRRRFHSRGQGSPHFEAMVARFGLSFAPEDDWGLWWQRASRPYDDPAKWSEPVQLVRANDGTPWHALGIWKPTFQYSDADPGRAFVFFDGGFMDPASGRPNYALGCLECVVDC
jgi:hypothetical protein